MSLAAGYVKEHVREGKKIEYVEFLRDKLPTLFQVCVDQVYDSTSITD